MVPEIGETYEGTVKSIMPFGAFIEFLPGKQGLLHISEVSWSRLDTLEGVLKEGDKVKIKLVGTDPKSGKLRLSRKALMPKPEGYVEPEKRERREGGDRDDRGGDRRGGGDRNRGGDRGDRRGGERGGDRNRGSNDRGEKRDRPQHTSGEQAAPTQAPQQDTNDDADLVL